MMDRPLRVVQVNRADLVGRRFNNFDATTQLAAEGVESRMLVWDRKSDRADVRVLFSNALLRRFNSCSSHWYSRPTSSSCSPLIFFLSAIGVFFRDLGQIVSLLATLSLSLTP